MAIYHFSHKKNKRSSGANVINKVAYRIRTKANFVDFESGETQTRYHPPKAGETVMDLGVFGDVPEHLKDPLKWAEAVERAENRRNSVVCREFEVALPKELSPGEMVDAAKELISKTITKHGMSAHAAIHYSDDNPHVHILFTERVFDVRKNKFGNKSRYYTGMGSEALELARLDWQDIANKYLDKYNQKISCKSHKDRGINEVEPTKKVGHKNKKHMLKNKLHNAKQNKKKKELLESDSLFKRKFLNQKSSKFEAFKKNRKPLDPAKIGARSSIVYDDIQPESEQKTVSFGRSKKNKRRKPT